VDAARALRVIEWVFLQVPYVVRARVLQVLHTRTHTHTHTHTHVHTEWQAGPPFIWCMCMRAR
jgi:hypothetical protein